MDSIFRNFSGQRNGKLFSPDEDFVGAAEAIAVAAESACRCECERFEVFYHDGGSPSYHCSQAQLGYPPRSIVQQGGKLNATVNFLVTFYLDFRCVVGFKILVNGKLMT